MESQLTSSAEGRRSNSLKNRVFHKNAVVLNNQNVLIGHMISALDMKRVQVILSYYYYYYHYHYDYYDILSLSSAVEKVNLTLSVPSKREGKIEGTLYNIRRFTE